MTHEFTIHEADGPLVAAAIHAGHGVREEVAALLAIDEADRLREEDPFTDRLLAAGDSRVAVRASRFEVDLNRPRESAVYTVPEDAWGLRLYREPPPAAVVDRSLERYDRFYAAVESLLDRLTRRHERVLVLDLHSYCHRRGGPGAAPEDARQNPEVNLGTESLDRGRFGEAADAFARALAGCRVGDAPLDVRENVRFRGGAFPRWINRRFAGRAGAIAIELKKTFMDEWTGALDEERFAALARALETAAGDARARLTP